MRRHRGPSERHESKRTNHETLLDCQQAWYESAIQELYDRWFYREIETVIAHGQVLLLHDGIYPFTGHKVSPNQRFS